MPDWVWDTGYWCAGGVAVTGRAPSGQALVASDEVRSGLHPTGFDPSRVFEALEEAVYAIRNTAGVSQWHALHGWGDAEKTFDFDRFLVWVEHWSLAHPAVAAIAALQDRDALLRHDRKKVEARGEA